MVRSDHCSGVRAVIEEPGDAAQDQAELVMVDGPDEDVAAWWRPASAQKLVDLRRTGVTVGEGQAHLRSRELSLGQQLVRRTEVVGHLGDLPHVEARADDPRTTPASSTETRSRDTGEHPADSSAKASTALLERRVRRRFGLDQRLGLLLESDTERLTLRATLTSSYYSHYTQQTHSQLDVGADLEDPVRGQVEEPGGAVGAAVEQDEEALEGGVHALEVALVTDSRPTK